MFGIDNLIINALQDRKSVRAFEPREIEPEAKEKIVNCSLQAPTAGNQMLYTVLDITDQAIKDRLAISCDNQPFIAKAPLVLIYLADCRRWFDAYREAGLEAREPGAGDILLAIEDALIAAQNAVVAAESLGIGSCYIGDILENVEFHRELLNLDKYVIPIGMLVFGYPTKQQKDRKKPARFDAKYIVMENRYRRLSSEELRAMFKERSGEKDFDYDDYMKKFCQRKYLSDFALEMSRSAEKYLKKFMSV